MGGTDQYEREYARAGEEAPGPALPSLCGYYLKCLGIDDASGVQIPLQKGSSQYVELRHLSRKGAPVFPDESTSILAFPGVPTFFESLRLAEQNSRQEPCLGYPVRISHHLSKDGNIQVVLEPVFLFELESDAAKAGGEPQLCGGNPAINVRILRSFAMGNEWHLMDESLQLSKDLGIDEGIPIPLGELASRLVAARSEWDWQEPINPAALCTEKPLSADLLPGIYNKTILFGADRSPFTRGLEAELAKLQKLAPSKYENTALGAWLQADRGSIHSGPSLKQPLLEPLPLNPEQRKAVKKALEAPLTTITGPPGTGKSQVVSTILINAARRGMKVLFVSKNNRAVDVVEERVNSLGARPFLIRMGRGDFRTPIIERIGELLAGEVTAAHETDFANAEKDYTLLEKQLSAITFKIESIVLLRNAVDTAERRVEFIRALVTPETFARFGSLDPSAVRHAAIQINAAANATIRELQPALTRLLWVFIGSRRQKAMRRSIAAFASLFADTGRPIPDPASITANLTAKLATGLLDAANHIEAVKSYFAQLKQLAEGERLEEVGKAFTKLLPQVSPAALRLWNSWLHLAPKRLTAEDRLMLGKFDSTLRLLVQAERFRTKIDSSAYARYYSMFTKVAAHLPCWAITSLSAKGRLPFDAGIFDLLVVDEASQCDIASIVPLLYRAKAAVIIGDPMQLPHISGIAPRKDMELLRQHKIDHSHPNWGYSNNSLFDLAAPLTHQGSVVGLKDHHRSHFDIIEFSNQQFYKGQLRVATNYDRLKRPADSQAVRWLHISGHVIRPTSGALNKEEAAQIVTEVERIVVTEGFEGSVGVATPFRAQANLIRRLLTERIRGNSALKNVLVDTVHRFQGDERDVILFSPVLSDGISDGAVKFLSNSGNLFNVAITRARSSLVVVGDYDAALKGRVPYLAAFAKYVQALASSKYTTIAQGDGASFPAVARPELVSDWERVFYAELSAAGIAVIPQYDVEKFTLDFALICGSRQLNIEVDGEAYHRDWDGELIHRDQMRNARLQEMGWDVMRFWVPEIRDRMPQCVAKVNSWMTAAHEGSG